MSKRRVVVGVTCVGAGALASGLVAAASPGDVDTGFSPILNQRVETAVETAAGKVLAGGVFTNAGGDPGRDFLVRLEADGAIDATFEPPTLNHVVQTLAETAEGKVLVGGFFTDVGGDPNLDRVARFDPNGSVDGTFDPPNLNGHVFSMIETADEGVLVGGLFTDVGGDPSRDRLVKLTTDGSIAAAFAPPPINSTVFAVVEAAGGRVLVGGLFTDVGGDPARDHLVRFDLDGSVDETFNPPPMDGPVHAIAEIDGGRILVGGGVNDQMLRLNADGSQDATFSPPYFTGSPHSVSATADGRVLVGGQFVNVGDDPTRDYLVALVDRPSPPLDPQPERGVRSIKVSWQPPIRDGGLSIQSYTVVGSPGDIVCATGKLSCTFGDLDPDVEYTFAVVAQNDAGVSDVSAATDPIDPYDYDGS